MVGLPTVEGLHRMEGLGSRMGGLWGLRIGGLPRVIGLGPRMGGLSMMEELPTVEELPMMGGLPRESLIVESWGALRTMGASKVIHTDARRITVCCGFPATINHDLARQRFSQ